MRVLLWSELYWPYIGGAERFLTSLASALMARGCACLVVTSHHDRELPDADDYDGIRIRRLPFRAALAGGRVAEFATLIRRVTAIRREFGADLVHLNAVGPSAWFLLRTMPADGAPLLVTLQQEVLASQQPASASLLERVLDEARWVVGCSPTVLRQARELRPAMTSRSSCIHNGVDLPRTEPVPPPPTPHVLSVGRLVPAKRVDLAIRATALLADRLPTLRLTIAGDGPERESLEQLARDLRVTDRVTFAGWIEPAQLPALMSAATCLVMPSRREGLPLVAIEAASMGRAVIASPAGGLSDLVRHRETGILVNDDEPEAWARAITEVVDDRALATQMGVRAREHVGALVNWDDVVDAYDRLYRDLTTGASTVESV